MTASIPIGATDVLGVSQQSNALFDAATANNWVIAAGSRFYQLDTFLDPYYISADPSLEELTTLIDTQYVGAFDVSPDGKLLVADSYDGSAAANAAHFIIYDADLNTVYKDETQIRQRLYAPYRWSPDGRYIVTAQNGEVLLFEVATKSYRVIANDYRRVSVQTNDAEHNGPSWSADSKWVAYTTNLDRIALRNIETDELQRIDIGYFPQWAPDGSAIVYYTGRTKDRDVIHYDIASQTKTALFSMDSTNTVLMWTPDSRFLVYRENTLNSKHGELHYYDFADNTIHATGAKVAPLLHGNIVTLPDAFVARLRVQPDNLIINPNR